MSPHPKRTLDLLESLSSRGLKTRTEIAAHVARLEAELAGCRQVLLALDRMRETAGRKRRVCPARPAAPPRPRGPRRSKPTEKARPVSEPAPAAAPPRESVDGSAVLTPTPRRRGRPSKKKPPADSESHAPRAEEQAGDLASRSTEPAIEPASNARTPMQTIRIGRGSAGRQLADVCVGDVIVYRNSEGTECRGAITGLGLRLRVRAYSRDGSAVECSVCPNTAVIAICGREVAAAPLPEVQPTLRATPPRRPAPSHRTAPRSLRRRAENEPRADLTGCSQLPDDVVASLRGKGVLTDEQEALAAVAMERAKEDIHKARAASLGGQYVGEDEEIAGKTAKQIGLDLVWRRYKADPSKELYRNLLVEHYCPLVRYHAEKIWRKLPQTVELDDLISAGVLGLVDAITGFDLSRGLKFETYCVPRIRGQILDELRETDWVPRLIRAKATKLAAATKALSIRFNREPSVAELAAELAVSEVEVEQLIAETSVASLFSLSHKVAETDSGKDRQQADFLTDAKAPAPALRMEKLDAMRAIMKGLRRNERLLIILYYYEWLTMKEIGQTLDLSESRVSQLHSELLARLRKQRDPATLEVA